MSDNDIYIHIRDEEKEAEKFLTAMKIANKLLKAEPVTKEEVEILKPLRSKVAMALSAKQCKGISGTTTVNYGMGKKNIPTFSLCTGQVLIKIDYQLKTEMQKYDKHAKYYSYNK